MTPSKTSGEDDYYVQKGISPTDRSSAGKLSNLKLKIKAKKTKDDDISDEVVTEIVPERESIETETSRPTTASTFEPAITFSKPAPVAPPIPPSELVPPVSVIEVPETVTPAGPSEMTAPSSPPSLPSAPTVRETLVSRMERRTASLASKTPRITFTAPPPEKKNENIFSRTKSTSDVKNVAIPSTTPKKGPSGGLGRNGKKPLPRLSESTEGKKYASHARKSLKTRGGDDDGQFRRSKKSGSKRGYRDVSDIHQVLVDRTGQDICIPEVISVKEFSEKIGIPLGKIIAELMKNGMLVNLNTKIDYDTCYLIGSSFELTIHREESLNLSAAEISEGNISELLKGEDPDLLEPRAPIVSIMGHVDHGKTSILDVIRSSSVASGEAGGITQKIGAYQVEKNGQKITFLDTPGHEAFGIMRSRGSKLTDLVVLVIAADEGMKPQTIESINLAREAGVPVIVAVNKMDKPWANLDMIKGQLAERELHPEDWGGSTVVVPVSAHTGLGIDTLLEMIVLSTEMLGLQANPNRPGIATVIESHLDARLGNIATILVNTGTVRKGDYITCSGSYGRIRGLRDFRGRSVDESGPSVPVVVIGLGGPSEGGDIMQVTPDIETAETKAKDYRDYASTRSIHTFESASLEMLLNRLKTGTLKQLKVVLKCDSNGSLEALRSALTKLSTSDTQVNIIHSGVGDINDTDVVMAGMSQALLIGYNVTPSANARTTLANSKIEYIQKTVIYHIIERVEAIITGMIDIRYDDVDLGIATVKVRFYTSKERLIIGLFVDSGKLENRAKVRIIRDGRKVGSGEILNLKSGPMDVHEMEAWVECGISLRSETIPQEGDKLEAYKLVQRK